MVRRCSLSGSVLHPHNPERECLPGGLALLILVQVQNFRQGRRANVPGSRGNIPEPFPIRNHKADRTSERQTR